MADNSGQQFYKRWDDGFVVRKMTRDDTPLIQGWFADICPTSCDLDVALRAYPLDTTGFYVGELDGEVVASAIRIPVCEGIYYGSYYYVEKKYRSKGFGRRIRDDVAAAHVGKNILCIDAHSDLEEMNRRHGYHTAFNVTLYSGTFRPSGEKRSDAKLVKLVDMPFDALIAYDNRCFVRPNSGYRRALLRAWIDIAGSKTSVAANGTTGDVVGFACRRPASAAGNHLIGPLYADSLSVATDLVQDLCGDVAGQTILISVCEPNKDALALVAELRLDGEQLHMIRMHQNGDPPELSSRVFGLTSIDVCGF
ncbi:hypothetical protein LSAT2_022098 [Lamellibrachia satsuma]|nr:hypothetical protein LSAT2_022098 [Lamellibrachia satsuma]